MNKDLKLNINLKQILPIFTRYLNFVVTAAFLFAIGFAAYQTYQDLSVTPDQNYLQAQSQKAAGSVAKIDVATINELKDRLQVPGQPDLSNLGKADPFSP